MRMTDNAVGQPIELREDRRSLYRLAAKLFLLNFVSLGLYRFWSRTRLRRYLLSRVTFLDDPLSYTGHGMELCVSFVIALICLTPVAWLYAAINPVIFVAGPLLYGMWTFATFACLLYLIMAGSFQARGYILSRIEWRGIRCGQDGSCWDYAALCLREYAKALRSGLYFLPRAEIELARWRFTHTRIGDAVPLFNPDENRLMRCWRPVWYVSLLLCLIFLVFTFGPGQMGQVIATWFAGDYVLFQETGTSLATIFLGLIFALFLLYALYWFARLLVFLNGLQVNGAELRCALSARRMVGFLVSRTVLLIALLLPLLGIPYALLTLLSQLVWSGIWPGSIWAWLLVMLPSLTIFHALMVVRLQQGFLVLLLGACTIRNGERLEMLGQSPLSRPAHGEGLQDLTGGYLAGF